MGGGGSGGSALAQQVVAMLTSGESGGIQALAEQFAGAGLGHLVSSWVGTGQNLPVSEEQLTQVLGQSRLAGLASAAGIQPDQAAAHLAQLLPQLVDGLTPNGTIPTGATLLSQASSLLGRFTSGS